MMIARKSSFVLTLIDLVGRKKNTTLNRRKQIDSFNDGKKKRLVISRMYRGCLSRMKFQLSTL